MLCKRSAALHKRSQASYLQALEQQEQELADTCRLLSELCSGQQHDMMVPYGNLAMFPGAHVPLVVLNSDMVQRAAALICSCGCQW